MFEPISRLVDCQPRVYETKQIRPITDSGILMFGQWLSDQTWDKIYSNQDCNKKAEVFQELLVAEFEKKFPLKTMKVCAEDKPWFSKSLKILDRKRKREFFRNHKSSNWRKLNTLFLQKCKVTKEKYYADRVQDLKDSKPSQWHSKLKRMSGIVDERQNYVDIDELDGYSVDEQANLIADHYAQIANQYEPINKDDFPYYANTEFNAPTIYPWKVQKVIESLNKKSSTVSGDIPVKLFMDFSV